MLFTLSRSEICQYILKLKKDRYKLCVGIVVMIEINPAALTLVRILKVSRILKFLSKLRETTWLFSFIFSFFVFPPLFCHLNLWIAVVSFYEMYIHSYNSLYL